MSILPALRILVILAACVSVAQGKVVYVSTAGSDAGDGLSWTAAKKTVQAGLNAASAGDQVWVAAGTYVQCITLQYSVALYGGFAGGETDLSQRNWRTSVTILDGNQAGSVVTGPTGATATTKIDGFTIRNGWASHHGGGIYCTSSSPTIINNTITGNSASYWNGGGIYCSYSSPAITNNSITGNAASLGGGIYCEYSSPTIGNNTIKNNTASSGGGIYCEYSSSSPAITNNTITGNTASSNGGGICCYSSSPTIANNTITGNAATGSSSYNGGGGIYCDSSSPAITNNTIAGNAATGSSSYNGGGGIYCLQSSLATITNNTITGNSGSGIQCEYSSATIGSNTITGNSSGGICCYSCSPTITNNAITGNEASDGGGICCSSSSPIITNNTIIGNTASSGGGIYCTSSDPTITNTIIAFNSSGIHRDPLSSSIPTLGYCCVYGNGYYNYYGMSDPIGTNGNISTDPQLADVASGNPHLQPTSPCIDAGDDTAVLGGWTDIDGQARVQGAHVDIGADESDGTSWPAATAILYVRPGGSDSNDGLSWGSAKRTVQAAINAGGTGSQIWVASGTYAGAIQMRFGMALYGGFAGIETNLSQRSWRTNTTILDGKQAGSVVTAPTAATASSRIDGFTIRNGNASCGGGIDCYSSSPTIANNTISGNRASCYGGGVSCEYGSSPTITNNTITSNTASSRGGGISCFGASPAIADNIIAGNTASSYGGGIDCYGSSPRITNNTIACNKASSYGGGISCYYYSSPTITNAIIAFNSSGIFSSSGVLGLRYCCVYGNSAYNYSGLADLTGRSGNISTDPLFALTPNAGADGKWATADDVPGDLHLAAGSLCINAGDPAYAAGASETDMDGQPRIRYGRVDIGAYEYNLAGDVTCDGYVNVTDLQALVAAWGSQAGPPPSGNWNAAADLNNDGYVNVADLQILVTNWGRSLN